MNTNELLVIIKRAVEEQFKSELEYKPQEITLASNFKADLHADELDMVELCMEIEDELNVSIPDPEIDKWITVKDVLFYLCERMNIPKEVVEVSRYEIMDFDD